MPKCVVCNEFLPPFLCGMTKDGIAHKCIFCEQDRKEIQYEKDDKIESLTKEYAIKEYKKYIINLVENNEKIKDLVKGIREDIPIK